MAQADVYTIKHSPIPCNLVLIGFMGTGKSTVSDYFHAQYNMDVIEMDQIIAQREGMSITDIFNRHATLRPPFSSRCSPARAWSSPAAEAFPCASATSWK